MPDLQPGDPRRLGSYELVERLGEGGQGVVFLGTGPDGTKVAVKLLRPDLTEDESARSRFVREFQSAMRVKQFCTAQVLEADVAGDRPYIVSEYIPGPSLYRLVLDEGARRGAALERLAIGTVTALVAIHKAGIVHRDFKPHNVLMGPDGPRVIDFGIARALDVASTVSTQAIGTPSYMAPEQVMGASLTNAVDVFAWASVMVFAATGRPPFGQDTIPAVINRILSLQPELDRVPDDLRALLQDCLAKEPERRPTAAQILMRLLGQESGGSDAAPPTTLDAEPIAATMIQPAGDVDFDSTDLRRIAAGAAGGDTEPVLGGGFGPARSGTTTPGLPPVSAWNTSQQPPAKGNRAVAVSAALAALALAAIVGVMVWLLTSSGSGTGSGTNNQSNSPAISDTNSSSGTSPTASQQYSQAPPPQQQTSHAPRHSSSATTSVSPSGGETSPNSPPVSPTGGGSQGPSNGPTHGPSAGPQPT